MTGAARDSNASAGIRLKAMPSKIKQSGTRLQVRFVHWPWLLLQIGVALLLLVPTAARRSPNWVVTFAGVALGLAGACISVGIHELCHGLLARRTAARVSVAIGPVAGATYMHRTDGSLLAPESGGPVMCLAAPASNLALSILLWIMTQQVHAWAPSPLATLRSVLVLLFVFNLILGVFNALPLWPLDGGRAIRAVLWRRLSRVSTGRSPQRFVVCDFACLVISSGAWVGVAAASLARPDWLPRLPDVGVAAILAVVAWSEALAVARRVPLRSAALLMGVLAVCGAAAAGVGFQVLAP